ncbi:MAG: 4-(cytidine 5'-diphospho)-2-C-methyl-D-erythritol kinase [Actinomycetota bacterium]|nr:4-(cytidine 5'-diphospho)-2-C-methyl-D-erythritol kinase [Actinomycetota bacterium]
MLGAKVRARAKINLFLDVGEAREDGYHEVRSIMQSLELSDDLYFRRTDATSERFVLRCNESEVPLTNQNLVWHALEVFDANLGVMGREGIEVIINKKIPVGAGLGGGSADAAATLCAMNYIYELDLPMETLMEMAKEIGSDVPFCLEGGTCLAKGRGEEIMPLEPLPPLNVVLAMMGDKTLTADAYARLDELRKGQTPSEEQGGNLEALIEAVTRRDLDALFSRLYNSFESATMASGHAPDLKKAALEAGAKAVLMTGSGPAVFALAPSTEEASRVAWELERVAPLVIITKFSEKGAEVVSYS